MIRGRILIFVTLSAVLAAGCSQLPGLRVLTGQVNGQTAGSADITVQSMDLVMADKTGEVDPGVSAAADRVEAADSSVNIIEARKDTDTRVFTINMLFSPPQTDTTTTDGQIAQLDALRRAFEVTWQGMMPVSDGTDKLDVRLLYPQSISTLDHGRSFVGQVIAEATIDRSDAATYLAGARNLSNFYNLVISGALDYERPSTFVPYQGTPNHPMFMLPASADTTSTTGQ